MKMYVRVAVIAALSVLVLVPTAAQADPSFYEGPIFGSTTSGSTLLVADAGRGIVNGDTGALVAALPGADDVAVRSGGGLWATTGAGDDPEEDTGQGVWRISGSQRHIGREPLRVPAARAGPREPACGSVGPAARAGPTCDSR